VEKEQMMKTLACGDLVPGCPAVVTAETEDEILQIAAQHAVEAHGLTVDDSLVVAVKGAIRDEES
jgi:predicted small metal-binding protein